MIRTPFKSLADGFNSYAESRRADGVDVDDDTRNAFFAGALVALNVVTATPTGNTVDALSAEVMEYMNMRWKKAGGR